MKVKLLQVFGVFSHDIASLYKTKRLRKSFMLICLLTGIYQKLNKIRVSIRFTLSSQQVHDYPKHAFLYFGTRVIQADFSLIGNNDKMFCMSTIYSQNSNSQFKITFESAFLEPN